jgi:hypothetical protein
VWNEDEGRCTSESISPLAAVQNERSFYQKNKHIIDELLDPVGSLLSGIIPTATADTQSVMTSYVTEGFSVASSTTTTGGDTNVTCELFQGEAQECKIAVGGIQDCCESPVTPSLSDYIKLMTSMVQLDSMTASMELIEGYSGVWNTAKDWTADAASSAWDSVSSVWATPADAATSAATEGATQGVVDSAIQGMMSYANDFLVENFSQETASMFFQYSTNQASGEIIYSASTQMASIGSALMVVYYAYLAYIVFTLLVNLIYECTDDEMNLAMKRELLSTHYLGSYCEESIFGACIERRKSYCMFDSPLSRIMMEQIYKQSQMGLDWGTAKNPNCTGLAITDVANVDWDQVDLSEWIGILITSDAYTTSTTIDVDSLTGSGSILSTSSDSSNIIETTIERAEDIDADEINYDAYDDAWNSLQTTGTPDTE